MAKADKKTKRLVKASTREMVDSVRAVNEMSGKRARFIIIALLASDIIKPDALRRACRMADIPWPIEQQIDGDQQMAVAL
jgi:hypothetical protein